MFSKRLSAPAALVVLLTVQLQPALAQISGSQGCWSSSGDLVMQGSAQWQTSLNCQTTCGSGSAVIAVKQADCWCGDLLPPKGTQVDDSECNISCFGFPAEMCGGSDAWNVYLTNPNVPVGNSAGDGSSGGESSASSSSTDAPSVATTTKATTVETPATVFISGKSTVVIHTIIKSATPSAATESPASSPTPTLTTSDNDNGGSNTGGIVAGVVVGVVALVAIILGTLWFLRKRRYRNDGHQRVQSTNAFATAGAGPGTLDTRLDPGMVQRRDSTGSVFADNQDYSRRILRVANPDNR